MEVRADRGQTIDASDFLLDRYEVTNAEYKKFVDAGGYRRRDLWDAGVSATARHVTWEEAMRPFVDRTGRPGPSTWVAGDYRDGQGALPGLGRELVRSRRLRAIPGQELPTAHHWQAALGDSMFPWLLPVSNFGGRDRSLSPKAGR